MSEIESSAAVELMCRTPAIEDFTPTPEEWAACGSIGDTYDLMKRRIRKGMATVAALEARDPSLRFGRALTDLPKLAADAGCYVGITVTEAKEPRG